MRIALAEETAATIRDVLGPDVDLAPDLVPGVLARLAVESPAVYSQVLRELSGSQVRLDSERELRRRRRRGLLRRLLFSWGEYETEAGDRVLEKRQIAAMLPLALAVLTAILLAFTLAAGRRVLPSPGPRVTSASSPGRENPRPRFGDPSPLAPPSSLAAPDDAFRAARSSPARPLGQVPLPAALPVPALASGLPAFPDGSAPAGRGPGSPIVVSLPAAANGDAGRPGDATRGLTPIVYNRATDADAQRHEPSAGAAAPPAPPASPPGPAGEGAPASLLPGSHVSGTLLTGALVVPGGPPTPVVVETADPRRLWLGQAVAGPGDRVQMTLTLSTQRRGEGLRAVALDPAGLFPGLPGRTTVRHASAAAAMASAALQAASDYAQAVARQGSLSVGGLWGPIILGGQVPEPWTYLAARLAQDFQARGNQTGWVTTIEIPAGTPIVILITGAS